jgi:thiopeptide-type bacteriocin biosynthesis protein
MKRSDYFSPGEFILRSPVLSADSIENQLPVDAVQFFQKLVADDFFLTSIYIASAQLYAECLKWRDGKLKDKNEEERLMQSLFKYWLRMLTRCTPYGTFAGCALGQAKDQTTVILSKKLSHIPHSRIDMNFMAELIQALLKRPEVRSKCRYFPNNSAYHLENEYRYIEYTVFNNHRSYKVSKVHYTDYLECVLMKAQPGATLADLTEALINNEITKEEAEQFIDELIESKILISELEPTITGTPFLQVLIEKLTVFGGEDQVVQQLKAVEAALRHPSLSVEKLIGINRMLKGLLPGSGSKDLFQTDLYLSTEQNTIKKDIIDSVINASQKLMRINTGETDSMRTFRNRFAERYEAAEMPLMQVLDPEVGIGYDLAFDNTVLLYGLDIQPKQDGSNSTAHWNGFTDFQFQKLNEALWNKADEIEITDDDIQALSTRSNTNLPDSMAIMGTLLGASADAIDNGEWKFHFMNCMGPSAGKLLGRFCHMDENLTAKVRGYLAHEAQHHDDCIYAEVVHVPQSRIGNVVIRPALREYEIPYVSTGAVKRENQILIAELHVTIRNGEVVLWSKRLNKRVIPRLTNAHNYNGPGNLPVYKFLCDLQYQNMVSAFYWDWGKLNSSMYLPRVVYGKLILKRARWRLEKKKLDTSGKVESGNLLSYFSRIRQDLKMPRYLVLIEGDNELFIDTENLHCLKLLRDAMQKNDAVIVEEFLSTPDQCFVKNKDGNRFVSQLIIPINKNISVENRASYGPPNDEKISVQRKFMAGSDWLYVKIYAGNKSAEDVLNTIIRLLTNSLLEQHVIDKWFFLRYADPDNHLRIRFHGTNDHYSFVLKELKKAVDPLIRNGVVQKIQVDTYHRELERYGHHTMELSEQLFFHDSEAVIDFIGLLESDEDERYRWLFALRGTDMMLDDFQFSLEDKSALMKRLSDGFLKEFANENTLKQQINDKYRRETRTISDFLNPVKDVENEIEEAVNIFTKRSAAFRHLCQQMLQKDQLGKPKEELIASYIHMFLNRLFISNQRKQELVVYTYLYRYYTSALAIRKKTPTTSR